MEVLLLRAKAAVWLMQHGSQRALHQRPRQGISKYSEAALLSRLLLPVRVPRPLHGSWMYVAKPGRHSDSRPGEGQGCDVIVVALRCLI